MERWQLDDEVLRRYIFEYFGHGSYRAKYWFVGMEFGGGNTIEEVESRIQGWYDRGAHELEDVTGPGDTSSPWFTGRARIQPTWGGLIKILLNSEGIVPSREDVRAYQLKELGRVGGRDCILELLPLPSPKNDKWLFYPENSRLPYLQDRDIYTSYVAPKRADHIRQRIAEHKPAAVVFYGTKFGYWWQQIAGVSFRKVAGWRIYTGRNEHTLFVSIIHPTAYGSSDAYFAEIGRLIAAAAPAYGKIQP